jgi:hypothetical protein
MGEIFPRFAFPRGTITIEMNILLLIYTAIVNGFAVLKSQIESANAKLDQILAILNESPDSTLSGISITLTEGAPNMSAHAHKLAVKAAITDFTINDDGTATGTISFIDKVGAQTGPPVGATVATNATSSDPGIVPSLDSTGLIVTLTPLNPAPTPLPTGVTVTAVTTVTNPDGTVQGPFTAVTVPIDLVADPDALAGASISLS